MAEEKTKYDLLDKIPEKPKKTKRNRGKTECSVNRMNGCGICGSLNICYQGVRFCPKCGKEEEVLYNTEYEMWGYNRENKICECTEEIPNGRTKNGQILFKERPIFIREIYVGKCLDCGAVRTYRFCPNIPKNNKGFQHLHKCWKHHDGRMFCSTCGFRKDKN